MTGTLRVLSYHAVRDLSADPVLAPYGVPPAVFREQLRWMVGAGYRFISAEDLVGYLNGTGRVPRNAVLLTFDDCYDDLLSSALPILLDMKIPAVAFAVSGQLGGVNQWDAALGAVSLPLLDGEGLVRLQRANVEIGGHSHSHRPLPTVEDATLHDEIDGCMERLRRAGLQPVRLFAYPHGAHDVRTRNAAAASHGLEAAFTVQAGKVTRRSDRFALPRIEIFPWDTGWRLRFVMATAGWRPETTWEAVRMRLQIRTRLRRLLGS